MKKSSALLSLQLVSILFTITASAKERLFVSFYPLEFAVRFMVQDAAEVWNPVDSDPTDWKPTKKQIKRIQESRLVFINGAGFEKWPAVVSLPKSRLVETTKGFKKKWLTYHHGKSHRHGSKVHTHKGFDGHTWMSPKRFLLQIQSIYEALVRANIIEQNQLDQRYQKLRKKISKISNMWEKSGKNLKKTGHVFTNHPAYNYLAKDYGFKVKNFNCSPDQEFTPLDKQKMKKTKSSHKSLHFWWESSPSKTQRQFIENTLKLKISVVSPSESQGPSDFIETMRKNASQFQ